MKIFVTTCLILLFAIVSFSQENASIKGNFQTIMQTYNPDSLIGAQNTPEILLMNSYANIIYTNKNFTAGIRYEGYFNTLLGYNSKNDGFGISYRFAEFKNEFIDITAGNFYEQFGNGLILRTYEDKYIGYDNALDGIRLKIFPKNGLQITGIVGKQRLSFSKNSSGFSNVVNNGLIRGLDFNFSPTEFFHDSSMTNVNFGVSFVSKYQSKQNITLQLNDTIYSLKIPENVGAFAGRFDISRGAFGFNCEYAYKINDPSADNNFIYKPGNSLLMNFIFAKQGIGFVISAERIDNFSFRADRNASLSDLNINYLPDITKNNIYAFSSFYPYSTQNKGEMGVSSELTFKFKKNGLLGGKYGTVVKINFALMKNISKTPIADSIPIDQKGTDGYKSNFFTFGKDLFYQDFNIQIDKKWTNSFKMTFIYQNLIYNYAVLRGELNESIVYANIAVLDMTLKIAPKHYLRIETEGLSTKQDLGNWAMLLLEYSYSPHFFFSVSDQYNFSNSNFDAAHYYNLSAGYKINATNFQISYGRQRAGVVCVGGVCRSVPATNGFMFSLTTSF